MKTATLEQLGDAAHQIDEWISAGENICLTRSGESVAIVTPIGKKGTSLRNPPAPVSLGEIYRPEISREDLANELFDRGS